MISQIQMPDKVIKEESGLASQCRFILQPLEMGYASTLGNSLRRVLLSSIPSSAIIGVKITDVLQEFQSIPHVVEDVSEIILNLKEVKMKSVNHNSQRITFHITGPCEWTAQKIQDACPEIEVMDPMFHIATISGKTDFDVELRVERGKGYVPASELSIKDFPVGMHSIDAVFTPVLLVNYSVEPFRVGQKTDYERLTLDVKTDGTITAEEAVHTASRILSEHIKLFANESFVDVIDEELMLSADSVAEPKIAERERIRNILLSRIDELELTVRTQNCFKQGGVETIADLVQKQESELLKMRNFGRKSLAEIVEFMTHNNLSFGMSVASFLKEDPKAPPINV